jgi:nucleotide-binding universal stress UspA family protein
MFQHILLPIDGSEASTRAVAKGAELAKALGAAVTLMTAIEQNPAGLVGGVYRADDNPMHQAAREAAAHWLAQAKAIVVQYGIEPQQMVLQENSISKSILAAATSAGADLIVMGSHGASALERLLIGSQTQRVLAHTNIAVMVLR